MKQKQGEKQFYLSPMLILKKLCVFFLMLSEKCLNSFTKVNSYSYIEQMAQWLRCQIPNPGVPCSKPLGGSKVDSTFHPFEVNKKSTRNFWDVSELEVSLALRQLNPIYMSLQRCRLCLIYKETFLTTTQLHLFSLTH